MQFVQLGNLPTIQTKGQLKFFIPGRQGQIEARATNVKALSLTDYEWYGTIDGGLGSMTVLSKGGKITASIYLPDGTYEIISTGDNFHILLKYDKEKSETLNKCATKGKNKKDAANNTGKTLRVENCQDNTRVLVLFTPAARDAVPDINQTIDLCISQFNQAVFNSRVTTNAYIELAGSQLYNLTESERMDLDLEGLISNINVQTARNNSNADYVILLTNSTNGNYNGTFGWAGDIEPNNNRAYAIVQVNTATNERKSFTHEAGHLYGCRHDDDATGQPYARGYSFRRNFLSPWCYTVMVNGSEITGNKSRLLNFSNPNVFIDGQAIGTVATNNNARRVTETFGTLRNFRTSPFRSFTAYIEGTQTGDECTQGNWEAVVSCGAAPYTYDWSYSYDGFNYYSAGSGEFYSATLNCPADLYSRYYVRLDARSNDGQRARAFMTAFVNSNGGPKYRVITQNPAQEKPVQNDLIAYPNPANNATQMEIQLKKTQTVKLEIINSSGQTVKILFEGKMQAGKNIKILRKGELPNGIYLYKLSGDAFSITKKLIIQ